jgi:hypothetical protein
MKLKQGGRHPLLETAGKDALRRNASLKPQPVAHACNPSYSGGRGQEDRSLKPTWADKFVRP